MNPTLVSWSSGKDAAMALHKLKQEKAKVLGLLTVLDKKSQTVAMHQVPKSLVELQAKSLQLPVHFIEVDWPCSNQTYNATMQAAFQQFAQRGIRSIAYGDLFLEEIKTYRETLHKPSPLSATFPLWGQPTESLAKELVQKGFKATLVCVDTKQLDKSFLGRDFRLWPNPDMDPCGENGEFHTFCWDGPDFQYAIPFESHGSLSQGPFQFLSLSAIRSP